MVTKKLNVGIFIISQALHFIVMLCFAVLLAKFIWWIINPAYNTVYVEKVKINQKNSPVKFIINRYPFGQVIAYKAPAELPVATQIKLNGVYLDANNSLAFISYNNKSIIVHSGDEIASGIKVDKIKLDSILIVQNGQEAIVNISNREINNSLSNNPSASLQQKNSNNNMNATNSSPNPLNAPNIQNTPLNNNDFKEDRKKFIERFAKQNIDNSSNENQSNNNTNSSKTNMPNNNVDSTNNTNSANNNMPNNNANSSDDTVNNR